MLFRGPADSKYVAFVDILGFGSRVLSDFEAIVETYTQLSSFDATCARYKDVATVQIMSDAFIVTSHDLVAVVGIVRSLHMATLMHDVLIRGGIGFGKHLSISRGPNSYIVSQGLVHAVKTEQSISHPCVAFHESVVVPSDWWEIECSTLERGILYYKKQTIVCPFNQMWGLSAMTRVAMMCETYPQHIEKFKWFLKLYKSVFDGRKLIPPKYWKRNK